MDAKLITFPSFGDKSNGLLTFTESSSKIPFDIKRIFWINYTPENTLRGKHAHKLTDLVLVANVGSVKVTVTSKTNLTQTYILNEPNIGLYIPKNHWHTMTFSANSSLLVFASDLYNETDYVRNFDEFLQ